MAWSHPQDTRELYVVNCTCVKKHESCMLISHSWPTAAQIQPEAIFSFFFLTVPRWRGEEATWQRSVESKWWWLLVSSPDSRHRSGSFLSQNKVFTFPRSTSGSTVWWRGLIVWATKRSFQITSLNFFNKNKLWFWLIGFCPFPPKR